MDKAFEYAAMRQMAGDILETVLSYEFWKAADQFIAMGLGCTELENGGVVIYPMASRRKNPAVVVVAPRNLHMQDWNAITAKSERYCYVYEAGAFDLARGCEKSKVRAAEEDTALYS